MTNVVIGAGSGMGAEVARALAPRGPLILADVDLDAVGNVAQELGGDVTSMACDVTDQEQVDAVSRPGSRTSRRSSSPPAFRDRWPMVVGSSR